jgi:hypothetical protein
MSRGHPVLKKVSRDYQQPRYMNLLIFILLQHLIVLFILPLILSQQVLLLLRFISSKISLPKPILIYSLHQF